MLPQNEHKLKVASKLITTAQELEEQIVLAGGALRDLDNDKPISDLDFFVHSSMSVRHFNSIFGLCNELTQTNPYAQHPNITSVYAKKIDGVDINIIATKNTPISFVINDFDLDICRIYFDSRKIEKGVQKTCNYDWDKTNQVITVRHKAVLEPVISKTMNYHIPKLLKKYPDYIVRVVYE